VERGHLVVWGGLTCRDLMTLRPPGVVRRNEDLLWQPANKTRCRSLATAPPPPPEPVAEKKHFFSFPVVDCMVEMDSILTGRVFEVALARLEWYYDSNHGKTVKWDPTIAGDPELASFLLCATLAHAIPQRETALDYQVHRLARERQLFDQRMAPFLQSEKSICTLLKHNAQFWQRHFFCNIVAPEPEDEQAFLRVVESSAAVPRLWIQISLWEAPCAQVAREFPLHAGGVIHLPCHPPWIATWIWESHVLPEARSRSLFTRIEGTAPSNNSDKEIKK
jgi:hypothetical protein